MSQLFLPRGCEIVTDEQGNETVVKKCKSAVRAERKRERMQRIEKHDQLSALAECAHDTIAASDSEDYTVNEQNETGDQIIYGPAPPMIENPLMQKELFLMCFRCPAGAIVEHRSDFQLGKKIGHLLPSRVQLGGTICRLCFQKNDGHDSRDKMDQDLARMMGTLKISPSYIRTSDLYKHILADKLEAPEIIAMHDGIAYISTKSIIDNIDDSCVLKSVTYNTVSHTVSYLTGGFF